MTQEEFQELKMQDKYLKERKKNEEWEIRLWLNEVNYQCPLCGKELQSKFQKKPSEKMFHIAHIYPNSPTKEQFEVLYGVERLGQDSESFENKIALCKVCHGTQDYHTTLEDYTRLLNIKKALLQESEVKKVVKDLSLDEEIKKVLNATANITEDDLKELKYETVELKRKFKNDELSLKIKVAGYVNTYFTFIREEFQNLEGKNNFIFSVLSSQIKACFEKMESVTSNKYQIFNQMVDWLMTKTLSKSKEACEIVISFFVQNCEVFREITE